MQVANDMITEQWLMLRGFSLASALLKSTCSMLRRTFKRLKELGSNYRPIVVTKMYELASWILSKCYIFPLFKEIHGDDKKISNLTK